MPTLQESVDSLYAQKVDAEFHIKKIQDTICTHPKEMVSKETKSDTGNYDGPSGDRYWYNCRCGICRKFWTEDQ